MEFSDHSLKFTRMPLNLNFFCAFCTPMLLFISQRLMSKEPFYQLYGSRNPCTRQENHAPWVQDAPLILDTDMIYMCCPSDKVRAAQRAIKMKNCALISKQTRNLRIFKKKKKKKKKKKNVYKCIHFLNPGPIFKIQKLD